LAWQCPRCGRSPRPSSAGRSRRSLTVARKGEGATAASGDRGRSALPASQAPESGSDYDRSMCRNIRNLHNFEPPASDEEIRASALQYVRKISGFTKPSQANAETFERAVDAVTEISARLLDELVTNAPPKDREVEAAKARARAAQRYAA
jgi:hypothetical protein